MQLSFKKCFECDWSILIGKILIGSCKQEVVNFFEELHKNYCGIDQMNSSMLANELINIFGNASIGTAVKI